MTVQARRRISVRPGNRVALMVFVAALAAGCTEDPPDVASSEQPGATDSCAAVETVPIQGEGHLVGDQEPPIPYNSTPPTSGWHTSVDVPIAVAPAGEPLTEPEQVTVLELGGVLVSYNGLETADVDELETLATERHPNVLAVTPYAKLGDGEVALTGWGKLQQCDALDIAAIDAFIEAYARR